MKTEQTTQLVLAGVHGYAAMLAGIALLIHVLACRFHVLKWRDLP